MDRIIGLFVGLGILSLGFWIVESSPTSLRSRP